MAGAITANLVGNFMNFQDLKPDADYLVGVCAVSESIRVTDVQGQNLGVTEALLAGLQKAGITYHKMNRGRIVFITSTGFEKVSLAERVASELEATGKTVKRLVTDPKLSDKSPNLEVQSFILAW